MASLKFIGNRLYNHFVKRLEHIIVFLVGLALAFLLPFLIGLENSLFIKSSGLILQILFIGVVGRALIKIRNRFMAKDNKLKPFIKHLADWFKDLNTLFKKRSVTMKAESGAYAQTFMNADITTSDKERIDLLRKNQKKLFKRLKSLNNEFNKENNKLKKHIDSLEELIKNLSIDNLNWEFVSLYWLATGLILRTYPEEIAKLF